MTLRSVVRLLTVVALIHSAQAVAAQEAKEWTATAGMMAIGEDPERPDAELFHVDYIKDLRRMWWQ